MNKSPQERREIKQIIVGLMLGLILGFIWCANL